MPTPNPLAAAGRAAPRLLTAAAIALAGAGLAQAGQAEVGFEQPERYTDFDAGPRADAERRAIAEQLQALAARGLPAAQTLRVTITDIDLAGQPRLDLRPSRTLRVMTELDWPRLRLQWALLEDGRVLREGAEQLSDMGYLHHLGRADAARPLPHERRLLTRWFHERFAPPPGKG